MSSKAAPDLIDSRGGEGRWHPRRDDFSQSRVCIGDPVPTCEPLNPNPYLVIGSSLALVVGLLLLIAVRRGSPRP
jgi:hypothetical protein